MNKNIGIIIGAIAVLVIIGGAYALTKNKFDSVVTQEMTEQQVMMKKENGDTMMEEDKTDTMNKNDSMMSKGSYEVYTPEKVAIASVNHDVVLFFRASWCPTCIALDKDIKAHLGNIPSNLTVLDVDYDNSTELKKKYGVTYQHTLVQVDKDGALIKKWSGSPTFAALVAEVK